VSSPHHKRGWYTSHTAGLGLLTLLLFSVVTALYPQFASLRGLRDSLDDTSILILLALGQLLVILTRAIDLSVAANVAFSGLCVATLNHVAPGIPAIWLLVIATLIGAGLGTINGLLVWQLQIPPIVVTLGTLAIFRGSAYLLSGGTWVNSGDMTAAFLGLARNSFVGVSLLSWLAIVAIVLCALFLRYSVTGRRLYIAGDNPEAAAYVGVPVGRSQCIAFVICGSLAGLCGDLWVTRFGVAYSDVANGFELTVIAACVIGGISIAGGRGTVSGLVLGCLFLGVIKNALPLLGISSFWQMAVSGAVIVGAVVLNSVRTRVPRQRILEERA
jgi:rhamnose transport system permease protein